MTDAVFSRKKWYSISKPLTSLKPCCHGDIADYVCLNEVSWKLLGHSHRTIACIANQFDRTTGSPHKTSQINVDRLQCHYFIPCIICLSMQHQIQHSGQDLRETQSLTFYPDISIIGQALWTNTSILKLTRPESLSKTTFYL